HLGCTRFHLIGQSIGGMIAQQYTHRFPEHVISLCLIATTSAFGGRDDSFKREFLAARLKPLDQGLSMHELAVAFVPEITGPTVSEKCLASAITSMSAVPVNTYRQIMECLVTFDQRVQWPALSCPVCLIAGGVDTNAPSRTMRKMAERNPNAQFHEIRDAGHLVNLEMPDATNAIITRFLHDTVKVSHR
nr:alpha/beta hydrolase [Granulosicoccus sp.]